MSLSDAVPRELPEEETIATQYMSERTEQPISRLARIIAQASRFAGDAHGLDTGERAALARLDPDGELRPHQIAALSRALIYAELEPGTWKAETWQRWALIAHGMALAGHDANLSLGQQLSKADVSESRVTKLLTARGDAFRQLLPRLLRLIASKGVAPNWHEFGGLILNQERDEEKAEDIRLKIAGRFFSAEAKKPKH
ncbi:CRISPR-associated protein Cse2 (CRISPR_cse2) [Ferrovum myxofaciens]|jgi:CRISPR system Cascade subunit CasB|uniref:CRISPR-associated protein Cse2 (CRISPR_cse2) n=1 Tax=Ferrovum myxofaciens TaxID=416213 RepID=A0A149VW78_9PROT|nr:type I-E CRISPR-associated protein Cse2/CasB [Ferrovum myxofaciens]KXW57428.1 CRISPR-associated protein Cse2 (CRISPR_cse2) [Ferrovum myxofaciens]